MKLLSILLLSCLVMSLVLTTDAIRLKGVLGHPPPSCPDDCTHDHDHDHRHRRSIQRREENAETD
ncbi:hypothetical protein BSL78_20273 [Apostichopus japonicus]|uniref:Uncharacterized protein n=1 Tax=Stichopus japonicus TaxID=307972 RepID=A0A2G8K4B7_STIJA|nr:hypothetical protein BSL78_20273 [Apostichopus japonicus]